MVYTSLPSEIVYRWCDNTLKKIDEKRKEKIKERVFYYMKPTTFMGITLYKGMSQDDAYAYVMSDDFDNKSITEIIEDGNAIEYAWNQYRKVEDIKKLCQKTHEYGIDRMIKMSQDDLSYLITD